MKIKGKKLEWNVLNWDFNSNKLIHYNVFYDNYIEELSKLHKKNEISTLADLKEFTSKYFLNYWSRTEYEIVVGDLFTKQEEMQKVDVYEQLMMNIDRIVEYVNNELEIDLK